MGTKRWQKPENAGAPVVSRSVTPSHVLASGALLSLTNSDSFSSNRANSFAESRFDHAIFDAGATPPTAYFCRSGANHPCRSQIDEPGRYAIHIRNIHREEDGDNDARFQTIDTLTDKTNLVLT